MTTAYTIETLSAAIAEAIQTTEPVEVQGKTIAGAIAAMNAAIAAMPGQWNWEWKQEKDGAIRAWAWTDMTPDYEADFGLRIRCSAGSRCFPGD